MYALQALLIDATRATYQKWQQPLTEMFLHNPNSLGNILHRGTWELERVYLLARFCSPFHAFGLSSKFQKSKKFYAQIDWFQFRKHTTFLRQGRSICEATLIIAESEHLKRKKDELAAVQNTPNQWHADVTRSGASQVGLVGFKCFLPANSLSRTEQVAPVSLEASRPLNVCDGFSSYGRDLPTNQKNPIAEAVMTAGGTSTDLVVQQ